MLQGTWNMEKAETGVLDPRPKLLGFHNSGSAK
jgi:hypothetical protein